MIDQTKFSQVIKDNEGIIYKISRLYTDQSEDQKDLYQEIIYQMWKSFSRLRYSSKVSTWVYRVALNTSISFLNKNKKRGIIQRIDFEISDTISPEDEVLKERIDLLYRQIKELNLVERGIILLFLEGKSHLEIAEITGFTKTNIGTRIGRIKKKLKNQIINN